MPNRNYKVTRYEDAFQLIDLNFTDELKDFVKSMETEGHTEKSICFTIWKTQDKLCAFKNDTRFIGILRNEINKWSWKKDDPRWNEYWKKKEQARKAELIRKEIDKEYEYKNIDDNLKKIINSKKATGYVYFIQGLCGGAIKIGYSKNPTSRLKELQTGYPDTLTILYMLRGSGQVENFLHNKFEHLRLKGEWFKPDKDLIKYINELKNIAG